MRTRARHHNGRIPAAAICLLLMWLPGLAVPALYEKDGRVLAADLDEFHAAWVNVLGQLWAGKATETMMRGPDGVAIDGATWELAGCGPALVASDGRIALCATEDHEDVEWQGEGANSIMERDAKLKVERDGALMRVDALLINGASCTRCHEEVAGATLGALRYTFREAADD